MPDEKCNSVPPQQAVATPAACSPAAFSGIAKFKLCGCAVCVMILVWNAPPDIPDWMSPLVPRISMTVLTAFLVVGLFVLRNDEPENSIILCPAGQFCKWLGGQCAWAVMKRITV